MDNNYLIFDIGGTNLKYGILSDAGIIIEKNKISTPKNDLKQFMTVIKDIIDFYYGKIKGIAFSCPGKVDEATEIIHFGGSLPFLDGLQLKKELNKKYKIPISVENDGKSAALAELWLGNLKNIQNGAAIVLGTGIGGGIVINGKLVLGTHFQAGELSFMFNNKSENGLAKLTGFNTSAVGMIESISKKLKIRNDGFAVFKEINNGNKIANDIFQEFCRNVAILIMNIQSVVDLQRFVISGGISAQPVLIKTINEEYDRLHQETPFIREMMTKPEIMNSKFNNDVNLFGALYHLLLQLNTIK